MGERSLATPPTEQHSPVKYSLLIQWQQKQNSKLMYVNQIIVLHLNLTFLVCMCIKVCIWILIILLNLHFKHRLWDILFGFYGDNLFSCKFWRGRPWSGGEQNLLLTCMLYINQESQLIGSYKTLHVKWNPALLLRVKSALRQKSSRRHSSALSDGANAIYKLQSCEAVFGQQLLPALGRCWWLVNSSSLKSS